MKKLIYILCVIAFAFTSCDDYLDVVPKGKKVPDKVEDYQALLRAEIRLIFNHTEILYLTDEMFPGGTSLFLDDRFPISKIHFFADESRERVPFIDSDKLYNDCYKRVAVYNTIIEGVDASEGDEFLKKQVKSQAYILRAFNHFVLVNCYAKHYNKNTASTDNGVITTLKFDLESTLNQESVAKVYDLIMEDINTALEDLPEDPELTFDASKAFGYGLKAKVHLFKGEYALALDAANNSLAINDYIYDLVAYAETKTGHSIGNKENLLFRFGGLLDAGYNFQTWGPKIVGMFEEGDARYNSGFMPNFPWAPAGTFTFFNFDFKLNMTGMKTTEVYLMKAECLAREGKVDEAMKVINDIRLKRIKPENYTDLSASTTKEAMKIIIDERAMELLGSFNRYWDIRRFASEADYTIRVKKTFKDSQGTTHNIELDPNSHLLILPFSQEAILQNSTLKQNSK